MRTIRLFIIALAVAITPLLWAETSPVPMLETSANQMIDALKQNKVSLKNNPNVIHAIVKQHLLPIVDVTGMSRSVLGRQAWNKATASEKQQFIDAFTQLVIRTYASPLSEYTDEKIKFLPLRGSLSARFLRVNSLIVRSNKQTIPLSYSLVTKEGNWRVYDFSVEGVSLLQSFRSQFSDALRHSSMPEIIKQLREHHLKKAA